MRPGGRGRMAGLRPMTEEEKKDLPKITRPFLRRVFSYLLPYYPHLILVLLAILVAAVLDLLPAILTGRIIDDGFIGGDLRILVILIAVSFAVLLASNLVGMLQSWLNALISQRIIRDMRNQMYAHLQQMSHRFFTDNRQGEAITRMTSDIGGVQSVISGTLVNTLSNLAILLTSAVAMFRKNWILALVGLVIVPLLVLPTRSVGRRRWKLTEEAQEKQDEINQILNETLNVSGQQLVKLFTNEAWEYRRYTRTNEDIYRLSLKESMAGRWFRVAINTFTNTGPILIYLVGGLLMLKFGYLELTVGDITVMVALLSRLYRPVNLLLGIQVDFIRAMALFSRIFNYLDLPVEIKNKPDAFVPASIKGDLSFAKVSFSYNEGQPVLTDISFTVKAGKTVAIVGPSGAGKSTIIALIPRLYDVGGGQVLLDGRDVRDLDLKALRQSIGVVTQESYLFNGTIRENLLYAKPDAQASEQVAACREANIHDFISSLPDGYDSLVGNRGVKLSGGEKQRLAIARAILKDPRLLILDEATSSLDSISESLIQQAIEPLLKERTSLVIAHRLSTIMAADEIIVLDKGMIVEQGSHKELLAKNSLYTKLYQTQFQAVIKAHSQA